MEEYKCEICNKSFKQKIHLKTHQSKKFSCSIIKTTKCIYCNKIFTRYASLKVHLTTCKSKITYELTNTIKTIEDKVNKYDNKIQVMEDNITELKNENNKLKNLTIQTQNNTNCNNTNNNTNIVNNNITIKVSRFGFERRDKLTPEENKDIIDGGKNCLLRCISTFHFNKRLPEYRNVLFSNLKSSRLINNECKAFVIYKLNMNIIIECFAFNNYITCQ